MTIFGTLGIIKKFEITVQLRGIFDLMQIDEFINFYILNAPQLMWFLGAGTSRSAGMPSATDIIWDLKRRFYCNKENQDITDNELSNESIRKKIQNYFESIGCPPMWSEDEYATYFKLVLGDVCRTNLNINLDNP